MKKIIFSALLTIFLYSFTGSACTSVIISSKASSTGRPLMYKNRDTGKLDNRVGWFKGPLYAFIGVENASTPGDEVWAGTNTAGFCIMNTASYNIKDDNVPDSKMDREGKLMFKALGICETVSDFEHFLDTLCRPMGVESNFGVIDAHGGAAYFEVNNHSWVKYDVNEEPSGYRVVTNFSYSGRKEDYRGYERYLTSSDIMREVYKEEKKVEADHNLVFRKLSRSYRNSVTGMDYNRDYSRLVSEGMSGSHTIDQDFIPRISTASAVAFEGVVSGKNPLHTVMWTILGYPSCGVAYPLLAGRKDILPGYVKKSSSSNHSLVSDEAMSIKKNHVFDITISNGQRYFNIGNLLVGSEGRPSLISCCNDVEKYINNLFTSIYDQWILGVSRI